ncbi:MAG: 2-dehydropantoate 2-reductase [Oleispira sp.]|nr:2-dehydropantoate 2-reductase [Oleispira sp.]MBL4880760.1 2-dehydropantoate 2-reductase [Oleispira sp.]
MKKTSNGSPYSTSSLSTLPLSTPLNIGIIGLGAIGCLISSQLPTSINIYALPRSAKSQNCSFQLISGNTSQDYQWPVWQGERMDIVILCCKASQCKEALQQWSSAISQETQIVLLQNGLGQHEELLNTFPHHAIFAASTTEGAFRSQPNIVTHAGKGQTQWGFYGGVEQKFKLPLGLLKGDHHWSEDIKQVLLDKLAINATINPLTVKYQCKNGELLILEDALSDLKALCEETEHFFQKMHWSISFSLFEKSQLIAQLTANNFSSMLQDVKNKRPTEIDFINGYLLNTAIVNDFKLPISESLINLVKSYELEKKVC